jgi:DNA polymerase-4
MTGPIDIVHLDMDCFFAAVEMRADPRLRSKPVIVGGLGPRGVVASCSYEARVFGVRSAMPMGEARRLCPNGVYLSGRMGEYSAASRELLGVLRETSPLVEPVALDEAFVDVSGAHALFGDSPTIGRRLRREVERRTGLACSVGIGRTKLIAKLASRAAKPRLGPRGPEAGDGVVVVQATEESRFLRRLPVSALPGAGPATVERLRQIGVATVSDLADVSTERLASMFGRSHGEQLRALAAGDDERAVEPDRVSRSIGHEETFDVDDRDPSSLRSRALEQADRVSQRCRATGVVGRTVTVKVRFADFTTITRSRTLDVPTASANEVGVVATKLLALVEVTRGVRLLGVAVSQLERADAPRAEQLALFGTDDGGAAGRVDPQREADVEAAADAIRSRFGEGALGVLATRTRRRTANGPTRHLLEIED